jgi:hypothetical protein
VTNRWWFKISEWKLIEAQLARLRAHRNNIMKYRQLLSTQLTEHEREYIEKGLSDEEATFKNLASSNIPIPNMLLGTALPCATLHSRWGKAYCRVAPSPPGRLRQRGLAQEVSRCNQLLFRS